jgi:hypothetical protein
MEMCTIYFGKRFNGCKTVIQREWGFTYHLEETYLSRLHNYETNMLLQLTLDGSFGLGTVLFIVLGFRAREATFTWTLTQGRHFCSSDLSFCNLPGEIKTFILAAFFNRAGVQEYRNLHCDTNLWQFFRAVAFVCIICSSKQTTLVLAPFFCHASFQDTETVLPGLEPKTNFKVCSLCSSYFLVEKCNFGLRAVLLSCLVFELQTLPSPGLYTRIRLQLWPL